MMVHLLMVSRQSSHATHRVESVPIPKHIPSPRLDKIKIKQGTCFRGKYLRYFYRKPIPRTLNFQINIAEYCGYTPEDKKTISSEARSFCINRNLYPRGVISKRYVFVVWTNRIPQCSERRNANPALQAQAQVSR